MSEPQGRDLPPALGCSVTGTAWPFSRFDEKNVHQGEVVPGHWAYHEYCMVDAPVAISGQGQDVNLVEFWREFWVRQGHWCAYIIVMSRLARVPLLSVMYYPMNEGRCGGQL